MNIFVASLPFTLKEDHLRELFEAYGEVSSAKLITDRETGKSKGFGFVEMSTEEEAQEAIKRLNSSQIEGRALTVSEAKPQAPRTGGGGRGSGA